MQLSKSDYMLYLRHPGWLWLKKHDKSKLPPVDAALQAMFDDGHEFERFAEKLFPDAVTVGFDMGNFGTYVDMPQRTREVIECGAETIFQGRLESGNITCIFDVIRRVKENGRDPSIPVTGGRDDDASIEVSTQNEDEERQLTIGDTPSVPSPQENKPHEFDLIEIKSSTEVKEDHVLDLAFQTIVLEGAGLRVRHISVIHVNREYVRDGEIDMKDLSKEEDVTDRVRERIEETKISIQKALKVASSRTPPDFSPRHVGLGGLKEWLEIYTILYPTTHTHNIFQLTRINPALIGELEDLGVRLIQDIPDTVKLNTKQKLQVQVTREDKRIIEKERIADFMGHMTYPLYFLDYETFSKVIPPFDGLHPYQQVPFQYSLHILEQDGVLTHKEYLHAERSLSGEPLLRRLREDMGDQGTVLVWYEPFEKGRNTELGALFPEYAEFMKDVNERVIDLMTPFSEGWFADKDFFGSASIKKVLPVLVSELSYKKLNIQEGETASRLWSETVLESLHADEKDKIMQDLREYCRLDTMAMVELFRYVKNLT